MPQRLHHMAFRCRDSEETRAFYEDLLGLPLTVALPIEETKTGRKTRVLHTFFALKDGSFIAFFEAPDQPFDFRPQHDFDLHLALESDAEEVERVKAAARAAGVEVRGPANHGFVTSTYFRDPNGYVVELAVKAPTHGDYVREAPDAAHAVLRAWRTEGAEATPTA